MKKIDKKKMKTDIEARRLYTELTTQKKYTHPNFRMEDHCEEMYVLYQAIGEYWKPRFLIDHREQRACEFTNYMETLQTVTCKDIRWELLRDLPEEALMQARSLSAHFPTRIGPFRGGRAEVFWQINPDGRYYMDEDGFGMSDDVEITLCGAIDRRGKVVVRFHIG